MALFRGRPVLLIWDNFESTLPTFQEGKDAEAAGGDRRAGQVVAEGGPLPALLEALANELREVLEALVEAVRQNDPAG